MDGWVGGLAGCWLAAGLIIDGVGHLQGIPCHEQGPALHCNALQLGAGRGRLGRDAAPDLDWTPFGLGSIRLSTRTRPIAARSGLTLVL